LYALVNNLSPEMNNIFNSPITIEEIQNVVKGLKNGKSLGIDGVINEYIKHIFQNSLLLVFDVVLSSFSSLN
jgi:hypothetical protein